MGHFHAPKAAICDLTVDMPDMIAVEGRRKGGAGLTNRSRQRYAKIAAKSAAQTGALGLRSPKSCLAVTRPYCDQSKGNVADECEKGADIFAL